MNQVRIMLCCVERSHTEVMAKSITVFHTKVMTKSIAVFDRNDGAWTYPTQTLDMKQGAPPPTAAHARLDNEYAKASHDRI